MVEDYKGIIRWESWLSEMTDTDENVQITSIIAS